MEVRIWKFVGYGVLFVMFAFFFLDKCSVSAHVLGATQITDLPLSLTP